MISTHVLDTALGTPARSLALRLEVREASGTWTLLASAVTDDDGRAQGLADAAGLAGFTCRLGFDTGAYFEATNRPVFFPWLEVSFRVGSEPRYHVPVLLNPFGYSVYRGS